MNEGEEIAALRALVERLERRLDLDERWLLPMGFEGVVPAAHGNVNGVHAFQGSPVELVHAHGFGFDLLPHGLAQHLCIANVQVGKHLFMESGRTPLHSPIYRSLLRNPKTLRGHTLTPAGPGLVITVMNSSHAPIALHGCAFVEIPLCLKCSAIDCVSTKDGHGPWSSQIA